MDFSCAKDRATTTNRANKYMEKIQSSFKQASIRWLERVQKVLGLAWSKRLQPPKLNRQLGQILHRRIWSNNWEGWTLEKSQLWVSLSTLPCSQHREEAQHIQTSFQVTDSDLLSSLSELTFQNLKNKGLKEKSIQVHQKQQFKHFTKSIHTVSKL